MPLYKIQGPDGKAYSITGPEGATREQVIAEITRQLGSSPTAPEKPTEPSSLLQRAGDVGLSLAQGAVGLGEAGVGLADIPTMGLAGKAASAGEKAIFGGTSQDLQKYLESKKTPEGRKAEQNVQDAKGFLGTSEAYLENPSALVGTIAESIPSMMGAAGVAKTGLSMLDRLAAKKLGLTAEEFATKKAAEEAGMSAESTAYKEYEKKMLLASAAGEGAVSAGSTAEQIRQQEDNGLLGPGQAAISAISGALTGALGVFGGKIADKLDVQDLNRLMLGDIRKVGTDEVAKKGVMSVLVPAIKSALTESMFEELPQSMQEQVSQNIATGKPWDQGVAEAGASGAMAAVFMGGAAGASTQIINNAKERTQQNREDLAKGRQEVKTGESIFDTQAREEADTKETPPSDTSFDYGANKLVPSTEKTPQEIEAAKEAEHKYKDTMVDEATGFPLFAGSNKETTNDIYGPERKFTVTKTDGSNEPWTYFGPGAEVVQDSYPGAPAKVVDVHEKRNEQYGYTLEVDTSNVPEAKDDNGNQINSTRTYISAERLNKLNPPTQETQALPNAAHSQDQTVVANLATANENLQKTLADLQNAGKDPNVKVTPEDYAKLEENYQTALTKVKEAREGTKTIQPGFQAPLFAGQQEGFDFTAPTGERTQLEPNVQAPDPTLKQQGLDFTQEPSTEKYVAPKVTEPKFGYTTETSAAPLMQLLAQFKPRSTSEKEREKQQAAMLGKKEKDGSRTGGLVDQIAELYDGVDEKDMPYVKGVVDSFFDKYDRGLNLPSKQGDMGNINNLNSEDQKAVIEKHTSLPDLTTYEGVKKLSDDFQDHVAEAQLAGIGITRASSAYKQIDPIVNNLRKKPKSKYDAEDMAAYSYFSMFDLDTALRSAAFDIATNTPRSQLFRGQGRDAAELFNGWLINNDAPLKVQHLFNNYVHAYMKQNEGFKAFQSLQNNAENEAEYIQNNLEDTEGPKGVSAEYKKERSYMGSAPLHPAAAYHIKNNNMNGALRAISMTSASPYQRNLAKRLYELNLNTSIGLNVVETLANDYTDNARDLLGKLYDAAELILPPGYFSGAYSTTSFRDEMLQLWDQQSPYNTNKHRFSEAAFIVDSIEEELKKNEITSGAIFDVLADTKKVLAGVNSSFDVRGVYFPISDTISMNTNVGAMESYVFLHESMHAATARVVNNPTIYSSKQQAAVAELKTLFEVASKEAIKAGVHGKWYGLKDMHEFIAEAFTNGHFQDYLKSIKYKYSNQSLWDKFVTYCLKIFGYDNVLSATVANVNAIFDAPTTKEYAVAPPLFASRNAGMFEGNSAERGKVTDVLNDLVRNNEKWDDVKGKFAQALTTLNTQTRKHWLGAFSLRQMEEMIGTEYGLNPETGVWGHYSKVPQLAKFLNSIEAMTSERAQVIHQSTAISKELMNIQRESKPTVEKLTQIVQTATSNEVDPTEPEPQPLDPSNVTKEEEQKILMHRKLKQEFAALGNMKLGKEAQGMYEKMRDFFIERLADFKNEAYQREFIRLKLDAALDPNSPDYAAQIDALEKTARNNIDERFKDSIKPYFPLKRFGDFWVRYGTGKTRKYMQFESAIAKDKYLAQVEDSYAKQLRKQGKSQSEIALAIKDPKMINHGNQLMGMADDLFSDHAVYEEVKNIVSTAGGQMITDPEELRKLVLDQLGELYITTLPVQSIQRMFLHRQNIAGASTDLIRSFQHAAFHMAYQQARFKYAPKMDMQLMAAKSMIDGMDNNDQKAILSDYLAEITKKYKENVLKPPPSNKWVNWAANANFMWFLTAPASAVVNMLAVPSIALPVLGGKFGTVKSWKAISTHMLNLTSSGWKDAEGNFDAPSLGRSEKLTPLQKRAFAAFSENLLEQSLAHDAASLAENPSLDYTGTWGKIMQIATFPFHKAERFNREVTAMAAFDLAYAKNGGDFDAAIKEASDLTWKTMFDYATYNKPRYMQGSAAKLILAFKQYSQHMTYLLFRTAYEATKDVSADEFNALKAQYGEQIAKEYAASANQLRAEARKQFMLLMGSSFVFAGASGLPLWWMYSGMANAFNAVFGDPEKPYNVENEFKNAMNLQFGGFVGDSISRGVIPQLTGLSLSDRMSTSIGQLWFRDVKKNQDEVATMQNMIISLLGPTVGISMNAAEGLKRFNDGHTERAFEAISPALIKNLLAGTRLATEGALTMKGDTLLDNISNKEAFTQMLGFTPERLAQRQSADIEAKSIEQAVNNRQQDLLNFLAMAIERGDDDGEAKVLAKIEEFNDTNDWAAIDGKKIRASLKKRAHDRAAANDLGGLRVNKKFNDLAQEYTAYANDDAEED